VGSVEEIGEAEWDKTMNINLRGTYLCSREALAIMKPKKYGKIVNLSSISGRIGGIATGINYATSKGGILTLTMSLAKDAGPFNITVNGVAPGFIDTEMTKNFTHFKVETVPLGRIGKPGDVADVILFLASDRSRYVTGVTIDVNGGVFMA
jgi:3-oxoacyl-[acyl-carrier protein] reductase